MENIVNLKTQRHDFDKDAVIEAVLNSGVLGSSNHQIQLFLYLINAKHEGTLNRVKAYNIAVDAFNRSPDFDASIDSIVRVEMFRLRANLRTFSGHSSEYRLVLPKASYDIVIDDVQRNKTSRDTEVRLNLKDNFKTHWRKLAVATLAISGLVITQNAYQSRPISNCSETIPNLSIHNIGSESDTQTYVDKIIRSTIAQQTSFNVLGSNQSCHQNSAPSFTINYALAHQEGQKIGLVLSANSSQTDNIISSRHFTVSKTKINDDSELYYSVVEAANSISMPDSILAKYALSEFWPHEQNLENYRCISKMYDSFSGGTVDEKRQVKNCLKRSLETDSPPLDNIGALALLHLEQARKGHVSNRADAFEAAQSLLERNKQLWLESAEFTIAKLYYEAQRPDFNAERLKSLLTDAELKYYSNPQVLIAVSSFYGYSLGEWENAKILSDRIRLLYPIDDQSTFHVDAGYAIAKLEGADLMDQCAKFHAAGSVYIEVIVNACARKARDPVWLEITEENLSVLKASSFDERMAVFETLKFDPLFIKAIASLLKVETNI